MAFFRNMNLGQRRSPTRAQLLHAFAEAGASGTESFRSNGTVVFIAREPARTARRVVSALTEVCGYADAVMVRPERWVRGLADQLAADALDPGATEVSVFDGHGAFPRPLPWTPEPGRVTVLRADARHAVSVNAKPRTSVATPVLERLLAVPVTSRGLSTILRLGRRIAEGP